MSALIASAFVMMAGSLSATPARAQDAGRAIGGIFSAIIKGAIIENARKKWMAVDEEVQLCLIRSYGIQPAQLVQHGVGPDQKNVAPYVNACQQSVDEVHRRQQEIVAARMAEEEKAKEEAEAAKARAEARHKRLVAKYGENLAVAVEDRRVLVGMTKDAVLEARGQPDSRGLIPPDDELWVYGSDRVVLSAGKVTYVGH